jgi:hypothetical protein
VLSFGVDNDSTNFFKKGGNVMKKGIIFCAFVCIILLLVGFSTTFAAEKKVSAKEPYYVVVEQIVTFSAHSSIMDNVEKANVEVDRKVNDFLKKHPDTFITDRKMNTTVYSGSADYIITVTIFYKVPLKSN